jgi:hypothetical protein
MRSSQRGLITAAEAAEEGKEGVEVAVGGEAGGAREEGRGRLFDGVVYLLMYIRALCMERKEHGCIYNEW